MLDKLNDVPWDFLRTADGDTANTVPLLIRQLLSNVARERVHAVEGLFDLLEHPGTSEATIAAIPFLFQLASASEVRDRHRILELLARIASANGNVATPGEYPWSTVHEKGALATLVRRTRAAIWERLEALLSFLADADESVRTMAPYPLAFLGRGNPVLSPPTVDIAATVDLISARLWAKVTDKGESQTLVRASSVFALAHLARVRSNNIGLLVQCTGSEFADSIRLAAALTLPNLTGESLPRTAVDLLARALEDPSWVHLTLEPHPPIGEWRLSRLAPLYEAAGAGPGTTEYDDDFGPDLPWHWNVIQSACNAGEPNRDMLAPHLLPAIAHDTFGDGSFRAISAPILKYLLGEVAVEPTCLGVVQKRALRAVFENPHSEQSKSATKRNLFRKLGLPQMDAENHGLWRKLLYASENGETTLAED